MPNIGKLLRRIPMASNPLLRNRVISIPTIKLQRIQKIKTINLVITSLKILYENTMASHIQAPISPMRTANIQAGFLGYWGM